MGHLVTTILGGDRALLVRSTPVRRASPVSLVASLLVACGPAVPPSTTSRAPEARTTPEAATLALGEGIAVERALTSADPTMEEGQHVHAFRIPLDPSTRVRITMRSTEVDALLQLDGPGDFHLVDDDAFAGSYDAMIELVPPRAGDYVVRATTASPGETGAYVLRVEPIPSAYGKPLSLGQAASARFPAADGGHPGAVFHFEGTAGALVRLRVTSGDIDPVAVLLGPHGERWANDDANDVGRARDEQATDSTLLVPLPSSGVYHLVVASYGDGDAGEVRIASSVRPPAILAPGGEPPAIAGRDASGRILGLFVGISDYPERNDLYGCADDARFLAESFRARSLQAPAEQRVLTDAQATRSALDAGLGWLASAARPNDVTVVFFSGHGNQRPAPARPRGGVPRELDGLDETIALHDGDLVDDDLVESLEKIGAGTILLAIDACHSGGFADDFVAAPNRIGVFSSDEDVLSGTAEPRRAGGYLAWHLRRAVLGDADARPADGAMMAGELTDFLYAGYVADHRHINPRYSQSPLQRLVVRRGSLAWSSLLWLYPRNPDLTLPPAPAITLESEPP